MDGWTSSAATLPGIHPGEGRVAVHDHRSSCTRSRNRCSRSRDGCSPCRFGVHDPEIRTWGYRTRKTTRRGGKPLSLTGLYGIFSNPFYMGLIRVHGVLHKGSHKPMVTPQEFERAQEILGRPGRAWPARHEFPYA